MPSPVQGWPLLRQAFTVKGRAKSGTAQENIDPIMSERINFDKLQILVTGIITTFILSLLLWEHFHGGVPGHYVLQRKDLPEISNWWGALLLPALTWILLTRINRRIKKQAPESENTTEVLKILRLFIIGLIFGLVLAISFTYSFKLFLDNVLYIILILGLIVPIFYSEFILGFILGMTYTFGAVLPTAFVLLIATLGFLLFKLIRPLLLKLFKTS
jgi:hypothetical protein